MVVLSHNTFEIKQNCAEQSEIEWVSIKLSASTEINAILLFSVTSSDFHQTHTHKMIKKNE